MLSMSTLAIFIIALCFSHASLVLGQRVNPISIPILNGGREVRVRLFAQIPNYQGAASRINHITHFGNDIYACTERSGGLIYKVTPAGRVSLYANIASLVQRKTGRQMHLINPASAHGGLRSLAFHPNHARNGLFYVSFMERRPRGANNLRYLSDVSNPIGADSVVAEFRFSFARNRVINTSYRQVIRIGMPVFDHPVKQIAFRGPNLYIAHGDGSVQSADVGGGQANDALGKIIRINPLRLRNQPYRIPRGNPFVNDPSRLSEIWAIGFRNPHNICFSRRGELFVTEAGRDNVEEVNIVKRGENYGWSLREGTFVHKAQGGVLTGIGPLPANDARLGLSYPNAQVGHLAPRGNRFVGQALAGGCPVENGSPNNGLFFYVNFPVSGELYYSFLGEMRNARVKGPPNTLTQARTYRATRILYDHDNLPVTPPRRFNTLGALVKSTRGLPNSSRVDIRFGQGRRGELYFSSKRTGQIFLITSSLP